VYDSLIIFMSTSVAPWHPSTDITLRTINSLQDLLGASIEPCIYCDYPPPWVPPEQCEAYFEYIRCLRQLNLGPVTRAKRFVGLVGLVNRFIHDLPPTAKVIFNMQHDWEFVQPNRIQIDRLYHTLLACPEVQFVRFHKRKLPQSNRTYVDRNYWEVSDYAVPLIATDGWGDSPHIATVTHYRQHVLPHLDLDPGPDGRYGMEGPIWRAYQHDIKRMGLREAQQEWGSFLYGKFGDDAYVIHTGYEAGVWRKKHKIQSRHPKIPKKYK